ncbi:hypothetical protein IF1G_08175 [Cordyceps javanica]|uniref:Uncharacterized protein n=1 Tax=Cordyceps javanica TaxID=43265 RepID=A0A545UTS7_9HYPO|nr:hypothetical protein IF1G_08175 [Cordyceps javanica]
MVSKLVLYCTRVPYDRTWRAVSWPHACETVHRGRGGVIPGVSSNNGRVLISRVVAVELSRCRHCPRNRVYTYKLERRPRPQSIPKRASWSFSRKEAKGRHGGGDLSFIDEGGGRRWCL